MWFCLIKAGLVARSPDNSQTYTNSIRPEKKARLYIKSIKKSSELPISENMKLLIIIFLFPILAASITKKEVCEKIDSELNKAKAAYSKAAADMSKPKADKSKAQAAESKIYADERKAKADKSKTQAAESKVNADLSKIYADERKADAELSKGFANMSKAFINMSKAFADYKKYKCFKDTQLVLNL